MMKTLLLVIASLGGVLALTGCGEKEAAKPTAQEAQTFAGKPITPEQRAKGMAAAMSMGGGTKSDPAPAGK